MIKIEKINLESTHKEVVDYLARLAYEIQANKNVIAELIERNKDNVSFLDSSIFKEYHKRFESTIASYDFAKNEFSKSVLPKKFQTNINAFWDLTYDTYELKIEYEE